VPAVFEVSRERFEELVEKAYEELPAEFAQAVENVAVVVEDRAPGGRLFGLYEGIPLTQRSPLSYAGVMPDRITLYQHTISAHCRNEADLVAQIRKTLVHELGHYFGIDDARLKELGWA
jgi:predicted Zn-dependent protease with MMP-like domain